MLQGYMITFCIENQQTVQILPANCFKVSAIITAFLQFNYQHLIQCVVAYDNKI